MDFLTICSPAIEISEGDRAYATRGPALTGEGVDINFRTRVCDFKVARSVPNRITPPVTPYIPQIRRRGIADVPRRARGQGRGPLAEQKLQGEPLAGGRQYTRTMVLRRAAGRGCTRNTALGAILISLSISRCLNSKTTVTVMDIPMLFAGALNSARLGRRPTHPRLCCGTAYCRRSCALGLLWKCT